MDLFIIKLAVVFFVIVLLTWYKRPLYQSISAGIVTTIVLYGIYPIQIGQLFFKVVSSWSAMSILAVFYLITLLQRVMEGRQQIKLAQQDLDGLFGNRRINASLAPIFIGLLPSAAAMIVCGDIVKEATNGYLDKKEQGAAASWFRHIPESTLPTYTGVLLMSNLSGVRIGPFILGMIFPIITMFSLGYLFYLRKLPKETGMPPSQNKALDFIRLVQHLWPLLLIIVLILLFGMSVIAAVSLVLLAALLVYRFGWQELKPLLGQAFEKRMLGNTFLILVLKEFIDYTGSIQKLPEFFGQFPIPLFIVFALLFFFGGIVSGTNGIIALGTTMAFVSIPNAGMPLMVLLMCSCHAASQISPTHICLAIAAEHFGITMGDLVTKTLPLVLIFMMLVLGYYQILLRIV